MHFNTIKKETENLIILTDDEENIIMSLIGILTGLFGLWLVPNIFIFSFNFNNISIYLYVYRIIMVAIVLSLPVLFILQGFQNLIVRSKATIDLNLHEIIMERKSIVKGLEFVKKINICDLKKIELVEVDDAESVYSWYINFVTNTEKFHFNLFLDESELNELSDKINKLITHE